MTNPTDNEPIEPAETRRATMLNLDTLEREGGDREPFTFTLGDRDFALADPEDVDWQDLIRSMDNPVAFFSYVLSEDDRVAFFKEKLPGWKLNVLMRKYQEHFGLPNAGEAGGSPR